MTRLLLNICNNESTKFLDDNATLLSGDMLPACMGPPAVPVATVKLLLAVTAFFLSNFLTWELRQRQPTARQESSFSAIFFLSLNLTNVLHSVSVLLLTLNNEFHVPVQRSLMKALYGTSLTAGPIILAVISADCYFAVVHPIIYMTNKAVRNWGALYCMVIWAYCLGTGITIFFLDLQIQNPVYLVTFYIALPVIIFCNITVLQALYANWTGSIGQMPTNANPTKRRAFWIVLNVLLVTVVCGLPQGCIYTYRYVVTEDQFRFWCLEVPLLMMNYTIFGNIIPFMFLHFL